MHDPVTFYSTNGRLQPPVRQGTIGSNAFDLQASLVNPIEIPPLSRRRIQTGLAIDFVGDYHGLIIPRSGQADKYGITVLNAPGLVDTDYQGEIAVILYNSNPSTTVVIEPDEWIAQILIQRNTAPNYIFMEDGPTYEEWLASSATSRGTNGFGSTDNKA